MPACLVDWLDGNYVVPWMIAPTLEGAIKLRCGQHSSWPTMICEYDKEQTKSVRDRHYWQNKKTVTAYKIIGNPEYYWIVAERFGLDPKAQYRNQEAQHGK